MSKFTVKAGRQIYLDGEPFIGINREGTTSPTDADEMTRLLCQLLNRSRDGRIKKAVERSRDPRQRGRDDRLR